jgi:hypothetical protein
LAEPFQFIASRTRNAEAPHSKKARGSAALVTSSCSGGDHAAMTIVRSEHRAQFTIIPNAILRDELGL